MLLSDETSSMEIIVNDAAGMESIARQAHFWARETNKVVNTSNGLDGTNDDVNTSSPWDNSSQNLSKYVSPIPTINRLRKRHTRTNVSKTTEMASGAGIQPSQLRKTTENFPPLASLSLADNPDQGSRTNKVENQAGLNSEKTKPSVAMIDDSVVLVFKQDAEIEEQPVELIPPHLQPKSKPRNVSKPVNDEKLNSLRLPEKQKATEASLKQPSNVETTPEEFIAPHLRVPKAKTKYIPNPAKGKESNITWASKKSTPAESSSEKPSEIEAKEEEMLPPHLQPPKARKPVVNEPSSINSSAVKTHSEGTIASQLESKASSKHVTWVDWDKEVVRSRQSNEVNTGEGSSKPKAPKLDAADVVAAFERAKRNLFLKSQERAPKPESCPSDHLHEVHTEQKESKGKAAAKPFVEMTSAEYMAVATKASEEFGKAYAARHPPPNAKVESKPMEDADSEEFEAPPTPPEFSSSHSSLDIDEEVVYHGNGTSKRKVSHDLTLRTDVERVTVASYTEAMREGPKHPSVRLIVKGKKKIARLSDCSTNDSCAWMANTSGLNPQKQIDTSGFIMMNQQSGKQPEEEEPENGLAALKGKIIKLSGEQPEKDLADILIKMAKECENQLVIDEPENSLAGFDGKLKPPPIGIEWVMRSQHDARTDKHKERIENWALHRNNAEMPDEIDIRRPRFVRGKLVVCDIEEILHRAHKTSPHDSFPATITIREPRRLRSGEEAMQAHFEFFGTGPEAFYKTPERRDHILGE